MDSIKDRIPTREDVRILFSVCIVPISTWAVLIYLYELPAYLRRMKLWDAFGIFSYSQAIALVESVLVLGFLIFVCLALPARFFKEHFIAQGTALLLVTFLWLIPVQYQTQFLEEILVFNYMAYYLLSAFWVLVFIVGMAITLILVYRKPKFEQSVNNFVERLSILAGFYIFIGILGFILIFFRNLF